MENPEIGKHLVFVVPINPNDKVRVFTSDGMDISDYFRITSMDGLKVNVNILTQVTLTMEASLGAMPARPEAVQPPLPGESTH